MAPGSKPAPVVGVTDYRYNERNIFSLMLQGASGGLETPIIFDSAHTFALLDKFPLARGHSLLVVKAPAATLLDELKPEVAAAAFADLQALSRALVAATGCSGLRVTQASGPAAGQTVPQLHFHLVPVYTAAPAPASAPAGASASEAPAAAAAAAAAAGAAGDQNTAAAAAVPAAVAAVAAAAAAAAAAATVAAAAPDRRQLLPSEAGPLLAALRNRLPPGYAPGYHAWAADEAEMEELGAALHQAFGQPGSVIALSGQLGAGKSTLSRGFVRAFTRDPLLAVPSPTFLLCLSYSDDTAAERREAAADAAAAGGGEAAAGGGEGGAVAAAAGEGGAGAQGGAGAGAGAAAGGQGTEGGEAAAAAAAATAAAGSRSGSEQRGSDRAASVHHMDPYRLGGGSKSDKMAGLIDFGSAFTKDACLIEWPDRMPGAVMALTAGGLAVDVSGVGAQASGRLVTLTPMGTRFHPPPPKGRAAKEAAAAAEAAAAEAAAAAAAAAAGSADGAANGAAAAAAAGAAAQEPAAPLGVEANERAERVIAAWRAAHPSGRLPAPTVAWRRGGGAGGAGGLNDGLAGGGGGGAATTINPAAAAALAGGEVASWVVLGIESSCDDTAAAVVRGDGTVLSHVVASQTGLHEQYGGVKPDVARQAHAAAILATVDGALAAAGLHPRDLTAVAVTAGPGLALCLQVGVQHGLGLAAAHGLPFVPCHHMEAHALMTRLPTVNESPMQFPSLLLLVSGGHNMLVLCEGVGRHRILGTTLDDSVGECFDKIARMAGIAAVPGGPHLERLAATASANAASRYPLTIPLANGAQKDSCNFSFSGLKTQVATIIAARRKELNLPDLPPPPAIAAERAAAAAAKSAAAAAAAAAASGAAAADGDAAVAEEAEGAEEEEEAEQISEEERARRAEAEAAFLQTCADVAASFQRTAVRFLQQRTRRALQWLREDAEQMGALAAAGSSGAAATAASSSSSNGGSSSTAPPGFVRSLVVAGGVAANAAVRAGLSEVAAEFGLPCVYPPIKYCTDNGLMVAWTGVERLRLGLYSQPPAPADAAGDRLDAHVQVIPRWPIGPMDPRSTANKGRAHIKLLH
ncbi:hypothetical protein HXX76_016266 [Chlamydomonas incerta]|uniref:Glycoprotease 1 n=1 Tax=Chlamydomonas incerta TaxID=51695 RepID=A0A835SGM8_CHLIN|nr:hypothetical protein HXX76_016266 [Chlamydomonas incerta]|eukprot:KAG2422119.1 hypothetical protein HXX76_016266 [Chlamydomonas incerta]